MKEQKKSRYLEYIMLTDQQHADLVDYLGLDAVNRWIEELNDYLGQSEKNRRKYDSHYHTIRSWARRAGAGGKGHGANNFEMQSANRFIADLREHPSWPDMAPKTRAIVYAVLQEVKRPWPKLRQDLLSDPTLEGKIKQIFISKSKP